MLDRARANEKVEFVTPAVVDEILSHHNGHVGRVRLRNPETNATTELELEGVFVAIAHDPNTMVFRGKLDMYPNGDLISLNGSKTTVPGVFVAGNLQDHRYRQAVTAPASGCMAAMVAQKFLEWANARS